jgi:hypothetical protein
MSPNSAKLRGVTGMLAPVRCERAIHSAISSLAATSASSARDSARVAHARATFTARSDVYEGSAAKASCRRRASVRSRAAVR